MTPHIEVPNDQWQLESNDVDEVLQHRANGAVQKSQWGSKLNALVDQRQDSIMAPHNCYRCKGSDKWVSIVVATDEEWEAMCRVMGNPDWSKDEAFSNAYSRWKNRCELDQHITECTMHYTHYEVIAMLQRAGVAAMPSLSAEEILSDPHVNARGVIHEDEHPVMGKKVVINPSWKMSETPAEIHKASPLLGEHNEEVFSNLLGMSKEEIKKLEDEKIIY